MNVKPRISLRLITQGYGYVYIVHGKALTVYNDDDKPTDLVILKVGKAGDWLGKDQDWCDKQLHSALGVILLLMGKECAFCKRLQPRMLIFWKMKFEIIS